MHPDEMITTEPGLPSDQPWWKELTRYHWFVLVVAALGWLFDTMDQQLFNLARVPAISELRGTVNLQFYGGVATSIFIFGWATGGIIFGIMGDRIGRARTMVLTILIYSLFTGLSAFSVGYWDFVFYRFLTGLGVGGEFAVGVALVAEVMPDRARPHALGWLQALSAVGNITAAFISLGLSPLEAAGALGVWKPWRYMFVIGALPAFLALLVRRRLKEPERWQAIRADPSQRLGSFAELFGDRRWRKNAIVGLVLASAGVIGLWGIGFFGFDLVRSIFRQTFEAEGRARDEASSNRPFVRLALSEPERMAAAADKVRSANNLLDPDAKALYAAALALQQNGKPVSPDAVLAELRERGRTAEDLERFKSYLGPAPPADESITPYVDQVSKWGMEIESRLTWWAGIYGLLFNIGAFFGIYSFAKVTYYVGRKPTFFVTFLLALGSTSFTFWYLESFEDIFWMVPIMGFCQIALFGGYAIYFPELFPTRLRSTGTSFCYNVGRYIAGLGPFMLGTLASTVFGQYGEVMSWRYAGVCMCSFFLIGLIALPFAPETRGQPLPE